MPLVIERNDPDTPGAAPLIAATRALMAAEFPAEVDYTLSPADLRGPDMHFFLAELDGAAVGCAALALRRDYGEVKSMYVADAARGHGVGKALLDHLEAEARDHGLMLLRLETGDTLRQARRLYTRQGFVERGPFGGYAEDPRSVFFEKTL